MRDPQPASQVAVIGGGISGLAAAHRLIELAAAAGAPLRVTLFEASLRLGGSLRTERPTGYLAELGADSFITNKPWAVDLCRRLALQERLIFTDPRHRRALVLRNGKPARVPDGFMLMAPAKIWPVLASPIFSPWGKLRMGLECFVPRRNNDDVDESVGSFVRRRFGQEALDRLVQPLVAGIYTSDPERLSLSATFPRFVDMERRHRSLILASRREKRTETAADKSTAPAPTTAAFAQDSGARYALFASLRDGMSELVEALGRKIRDAGEVHLNARVARIHPLAEVDGPLTISVDESRSQASTAGHDGLGGAQDSRRETFDAVVLALPTECAANLTEVLDPQLAAALREIELASSAIVVTGHSLADISHPLDASGLVVPAIERRSILSVSFASRKFAGRASSGKVVLRTFVGGALQPELLTRSNDELIEGVLAELADILGVRGSPEFAIVSRYERSMPQYHVGHLDRVAQIEQIASRHDRLVLAGNAYHGVGIPDCVHSGEQAAERVFEVLRQRPAVERGVR